MRARNLLFCLLIAAPALSQSPIFIKPTLPARTFTATPYDSRTELPARFLAPIASPLARAQARLKAVKAILIARNDSVCYTMRSYKFEQQDHSSDRTTYRSSSNCEASKDTHMKEIAVPPVR